MVKKKKLTTESEENEGVNRKVKTGCVKLYAVHAEDVQMMSGIMCLRATGRQQRDLAMMCRTVLV